MTKKSFNQNIKFEKDLASTFEPDFTYNNRPINRFDTSKKDNTQNILSKTEKLLKVGYLRLFDRPRATQDSLIGLGLLKID